MEDWVKFKVVDFKVELKCWDLNVNGLKVEFVECFYVDDVICEEGKNVEG